MPVAPRPAAEKLAERVAKRIAELKEDRRMNLVMIEDCKSAVEEIDALLDELQKLAKGTGINKERRNGTTNRGEVPEAIRILLDACPEGLTSKEIADDVISGRTTDDRSLIHATLFNFKKHKKVRFDEKTGKYFAIKG